ncbi:MAG: hypothetical protein U5K81_11115 [Trueperaceae bacterium]|nr:hypothetical protein [Trueperaceae bacterium]
MISPAYRTCVAALERWLSPRVVSRTLRMAMQPAGLTPETVAPDDLAPILQNDVFKQLQVVMPPDRAREVVREILDELAGLDRAGAGHEGDTEVASPHGAAPTREAAPSAPPEDAEDGAERDGEHAGGNGPEEAPSAVPEDAPERAELARLRDAMRPFNLYFEWPEVRRLRALLTRIEGELARGDRPVGPLEEADTQLNVVHQKLEDALVLQARSLAELEETFEEVKGLGGAKVRRLDTLLRHVREAQASRQLAEAEIERAQRVTFDLRKLMASSVYQEEHDAGDEALDARLKALEREADTQELDALARERAVLLEHRDDVGEKVRATRAALEEGRPPQAGIDALRAELDEAESARLAELAAELDEADAFLAAHPDADGDDVRSELALLRETLDDGLPRLADLVRFRDLLDLAMRRARREDEHAEHDAAETRQRLDAQGEFLTRARQDYLRYAPHADEQVLGRYQEALEALRAAQAEERIDDEAAGAVREAGDALAAQASGSDEEAHVQLQVRALLSTLDGLPMTLDPDGARALQQDLEAWLTTPPDEEELASGAASVADFVDRAHADARARLERMGQEAAHWSLTDVLEAVRAANERLEDGADPEISAVLRQLGDAREAARAAQLERLHALERVAERLSGIDDGQEAALAHALSDARQGLVDGTSSAAVLDRADGAVDALESTLRTRIEGFMPRLDAALETFRTVERLNSEDVATVRRILGHLDAQRGAFGRISPGLRAGLERSLQEAEDLLAKLEEEERATRAIADRLMTGGEFTDVLGLFGPAEGRPERPADDARGAPDDTQEETADDWVARHGEADGVACAALLAPEVGVVAGRGLPEPAERRAAVATATQRVLRDLTRLGSAWGLGRPRVVSLEGPERAVLLGHAPDATALLATPDPAALGLLLRELRREASWRDAVRRARNPGAEHEDDATDAS